MAFNIYRIIGAIYIGYKRSLIVDEKPSVLIFINELSICFRAEQIDTDGRRKIVCAKFLRIFATKSAQK